MWLIDRLLRSKSNSNHGKNKRSYNKCPKKAAKRGRPGKKYKKDSVIRLRIEKAQKDLFFSYCDDLEIKPSNVLGNFVATFNLNLGKAKTDKSRRKIAERLQKVS